MTQHELHVTVNGEEHALACDPDFPLLDVLRAELGLAGPRFGCGVGLCGACMVIIDGKPRTSCDYPAWAAEGTTVTTVEGLADGDRLHAVQQAFLDAQAAQCGWCTNAQIMAASSYIEHGVITASTSVDDIKTAMNSYMCRCGTHYRIIEAIQNAAKAMAK